MPRVVISAAVICDNCHIILVEKQGVWILPGGKPNPKESDVECLSRALCKKLNVEIVGQPKFYRTFTKITPGKKDTLITRVYRLEIKGEPVCKYAYTQTPMSFALSGIAKLVIASLESNGFLNDFIARCGTLPTNSLPCYADDAKSFHFCVYGGTRNRPIHDLKVCRKRYEEAMRNKQE